jgi:hypothetical protein
MDTCVRNGIYDEALDLHAFIMRVALLHPDMPIVKLLAAQVTDCFCVLPLVCVVSDALGVGQICAVWTKVLWSPDMNDMRHAASMHTRL